jgi:hypothetical protein
VPRALVYLWTLPTTTVGLIFLPFVRMSLGEPRGGMKIVDGVLELHGGMVAWFLRHCTLLPGGASAMALGHVVLARDEQLLADTRAHERVHVRQAERWGPFFLPAYALASIIAWCRGQDPYRDNRFEREAYAVADVTSA